ncbi:MAG: type II and III secretion system protein, partial [Thermodesulfovibrionales bacterium]|nr:type II and III secretion system protein [Thermodesulfovibrionales bacterium]
DLETALGAIKRAMALNKPDAPEIMSAYSLISAASGQFGKAKAQLAIYSEIESNKPRVNRLTERISDWQKFHENKGFLVASDSSVESAERQPVRDALTTDTVKAANDPAEKNKPRMVIVDVILIRTEEIETTSKGVNLLDGLFLQFDSKLLDFTRTYTKNMVNSGDATNTNFTNNDNKVVTTNIAIPQIKYNLNIFNVGKDHSEILAKPTLVALEGQKSVFFSGSQLNVAVAGVQTGSLEKIDVGVRLEVTPTFISDDTVVLNVTAGRNFVETGIVGNFNESVRTSKNEVSVNAVLKFGQTLIIGGLREKQTSEVKSGVPFLRDIPVVQYLFSKETTMDFHKSILTILTPRKVSPGVHTSPTGAESGETVSGGTNDQQALKELKDAYNDIFTIDDNMHHIVSHLKKHSVFREFRETDLYDKPWYGHADGLKNIIARTLSFLYY